jgi:ribonucleotide monophosphatase NagD (HAD superfamily)
MQKNERKVNDMDISTMGTVLAIVVITYLIGLAAKRMNAIDDEWIPVIVGVSGGILGVIGMYVIPDFPAHDILNAIAVGIVSGLASTGVNQAYKQLKG